MDGLMSRDVFRGAELGRVRPFSQFTATYTTPLRDAWTTPAMTPALAAARPQRWCAGEHSAISFARDSRVGIAQRFNLPPPSPARTLWRAVERGRLRFNDGERQRRACAGADPQPHGPMPIDTKAVHE